MSDSRLSALGYRFSNPESALLGPDSEVEANIAFLEENIGKVPLALSSFYRVVGCVDFTGGHPEWEGCEYPDPIVVDPVAYSVSEAQEFLELESPNAIRSQTVASFEFLLRLTIITRKM